MSATAATLSHVYPIGSRINDRGRLEIGGCDAVELAREFGTPAYVVAEDDLRARARSFADALGARHADYDVLFASKAFPCTAVYRLLADEGLACDVASGGELFLALRGGFDPARIYLHGNAKSESELREALEAGRRATSCSTRWTSSSGSSGSSPSRRSAPGGADPGHSGRRRRHPSRDLDRPDRLEVRVLARGRRVRRSSGSRRAPHLDLVGLHFHIGSQLLELEPFRAAVRAIASLGDFPVYNLGGGLGVAYTSAIQPPAVADYVRRDRHARVHIRAGAGQAAAARARAGAGRELRRSRCTRSRPSSGTSRPGLQSTAGCPTTCARCSTARCTRR